MIIKIDCDLQTKEEAKEIAKGMGYAGSMIRGARDAHAALAELVVNAQIKGTLRNTFDFDIETKNGLRVDVKNKTKSVGVEPKPNFEVTIMASNEKQDCDYLVFTMTPKDGSCVWICGGYGKLAFLRDAEFRAAGTMTDSNYFEYKRDNYIMTVEQLEAAEMVLPWLAGDTLHERDLQAIDVATRLTTINSLEELEGFANRRRIFRADFPPWTDEQRAMILGRKYELEKLKRGKRK
jgi:hypothetical protein